MLSNLLPKKLWISKYHTSRLCKDLSCENYTLPSQKHDWVFIQFTRLRCVLVWKCYISCWSLQNTSTALPLKQPVLLPNNSTALFLAQMLDTSRWEKKPSHILPKTLLFFDCTASEHKYTWRNEHPRLFPWNIFFQSQEYTLWTRCHPSFCCAVAHPYKAELKFEVHFPRFSLEIAL